MAKRDQMTFYMRPMDDGDIPAISLWCESLEDLTLFDSQSGLPVSSTRVRKDWEKAIAGEMEKPCYWFGVDDDAGRLVGIAGVEAISHMNGDCVLPIMIARQFRYKGLGVQIAAMIIDMVFDQLRLNRITTYYRADNDVTRRLITTLGFEHEGRMRQARFANGRYHDQMVVGLLAEDWPDHREKIAAKLDGTVALSFGRAGEVLPVWPATSL